MSSRTFVHIILVYGLHLTFCLDLIFRMLSTLTLEQKRKAFERARDASNITEGKLVLVTEEYYDDALTLMEHYAKDEPASKSLNLEWTPEYSNLFLVLLRDNMSLMLINSDTGEPMAIRIIRIARSNQKTEPDKAIDPGIKKYLALVKHCDDMADFFGSTGAGREAFHFFGLSTAPKYRHQALAKKIFSAAIEMVQGFDLEKVYIKGEGTSNYAQNIYEKAGFRKLYEVQFSEYIVDGTQVFCNTGDHKSMKVYCKTITKS